jgi:hypothetical protein
MVSVPKLHSFAVPRSRTARLWWYLESCRRYDSILNLTLQVVDFGHLECLRTITIAGLEGSKFVELKSLNLGCFASGVEENCPLW